MPDDGDHESSEETAPVDYDILDRIGRRLAGSERFEAVDSLPEFAPNSLVLRYDQGYFPAGIEQAFLQVRWYENDDFSFHYHEHWEDGDRWDCRWDRHPNTHTTREHFHPPPDAATPGIDDSYPDDWRDVVVAVLRELDSHIKEFWN